MKLLKKGTRHWKFALDGGEDVASAVEAIARAAFELARPVEMGILQFDAAVQWRDVRQSVLSVRDPDPDCLLHMGYVGGRRCKTSILRGNGCLKIYRENIREADMRQVFLLANKHLIKCRKRTIVPAPRPDIVQ